ncbi:hypothetical protein D3C80_2006230 [compost metagenome]
MVRAPMKGYDKPMACKAVMPIETMGSSSIKIRIKAPGIRIQRRVIIRPYTMVAIIDRRMASLTLLFNPAA